MCIHAYICVCVCVCVHMWVYVRLWLGVYDQRMSCSLRIQKLQANHNLCIRRSQNFPELSMIEVASLLQQSVHPYPLLSRVLCQGTWFHDKEAWTFKAGCWLSIDSIGFRVPAHLQNIELRWGCRCDQRGIRRSTFWTRPIAVHKGSKYHYGIYL